MGCSPVESSALIPKISVGSCLDVHLAFGVKRLAFDEAERESVMRVR